MLQIIIINMDAMLLRRWLPNVSLLSEQIKRHDVTQKCYQTPEGIAYTSGYSTARYHIPKRR
jgi:hypothetical protein